VWACLCVCVRERGNLAGLVEASGGRHPYAARLTSSLKLWGVQVQGGGRRKSRKAVACVLDTPDTVSDTSHSCQPRLVKCAKHTCGQ